MSRSGRKTLPDVSQWWEALPDVRQLSGALTDVRKWSGGPPKYPGVVERPS